MATLASTLPAEAPIDDPTRRSPPPEAESKWRRMLFPDEKRRPTWLRWTRITLRTCHILCIAGLVGTVLAGADEATFDPWLTAAIASGLALLSTFAYQTLGWFLEISGLVMILKLTALGVMSAHPEWRLPILVGLLIISSFSSHMPGRVRHWVPPPLR